MDHKSIIKNPNNGEEFVVFVDKSAYTEWRPDTQTDTIDTTKAFGSVTDSVIRTAQHQPAPGAEVHQLYGDVLGKAPKGKDLTPEEKDELATYIVLKGELRELRGGGNKITGSNPGKSQIHVGNNPNTGGK